jgi:hypothetical protein
MHKLVSETDKLLSQEIDQAEAYMGQKAIFIENGYVLRKVDRHFAYGACAMYRGTAGEDPVEWLYENSVSI